MKTLVLVSLFLVACGGPQFQSEDVTEEDAGSDSNPLLPDTLAPSPDATRVDGRSGFETDAAPDTHNAQDGWPSDVILEPYCPTSEVYPIFSNTCYTWGAEHGWTLPGCCLPDHRCGAVYGNPPKCNP